MQTRAWMQVCMHACRRACTQERQTVLGGCVSFPLEEAKENTTGSGPLFLCNACNAAIGKNRSSAAFTSGHTLPFSSEQTRPTMTHSFELPYERIPADATPESAAVAVVWLVNAVTARSIWWCVSMYVAECRFFHSTEATIHKGKRVTAVAKLRTRLQQ